MNAPPAETRRKLLRAGLILAAALVLFWPALLNRSPLLFPDSFAYLYPGRNILAKLVGARPPLSLYGMDRSEVFAIGLALVTVGSSLWPVVAIAALATAWVLWMLVRTLLPSHAEGSYAVVMLVLTCTTSLAWYVGFVMPDIWGGLAYLAMFLLLFAWERLRRWEQILLACIAVWSLAIHTSHLLVALVLLAWWAAFVFLRGQATSGRRSGLALLVAILVATASLLGFVHKRLYGHVSLFGYPPPFLMGRLLADGPAREYLLTHCAESSWDICTYRNALPRDEDNFLHNPAGIYAQANAEERASLRNEQIPLLFKTVETYPVAQIIASTHNAWRELTSVGPTEFGYVGPTPPSVRPSFAWSYEHSRQISDGLPHDSMRILQTIALEIALGVIVLLIPVSIRRGSTLLPALGFTVVLALVVNAIVTAALSGVYTRYQDRVQWLLVLLALLLLLETATSRKRPV